MLEIHLKLRMKTPERRQLLQLVSLSLTLNIINQLS